MFSRQESSRIRQEFWTTFGKYMSPIPSSEGMKINWVNYHTRVKDVYFRMYAGSRSASIAISIEHRDEGLQELYYEQFLELKFLLHETLGEEWKWRLHVEEEGKVNSRIFRELHDVSVFNRDHWPQLISFFKPRIIALDSFWENARYSFDELK
jgi:hypothetical protein